jgi:DNA-binding transcriptional LysR family regulator
MELRVLQYFLAVAREQSISGAAEFLHLSQPTLSRQLKDMEDELGKQLIIRGNRKIQLTNEGMILRKRAEEIMELVKKTENEITYSDEYVAGDIYIGAGETDGVRLLSRAVKELQSVYPLIHFHVVSGDAQTVLEQLDKGLLDFGLLLGQTDLSKYDYIKLPCKDVWGVLMRRDSPLAEKKAIKPEDLAGKPLIISRQSNKQSELFEWLKTDNNEPNIVATYNLVYNGSLMVDEGIGYALCLDKIINTSGDSNLCFRPFEPRLELGMNLVWKKYQTLTNVAEKFLVKLREMMFDLPNPPTGLPIQ